MSIAREITDSFRNNDIIIKLIYINTGMFIVMRLMDIAVLSGAFYTGWAMTIFGMPLGLDVLLKPWTIATNIITHYDLVHFIFNIISLYWLGRLFMTTYNSERRALKAYIYGGLTGCLLSMVSALACGSGGILLGASGSVMCLLVATAVAEPDRRIWLTFVGEIRLKYVAAVYIGLSVIMLLGLNNIGGNLAHIGGALMGYLLAKSWAGKPERPRGRANSLSSLFTRRPKMTVLKGTGNQDWDYNARKLSTNKELDRILDKIKAQGYNSLTDKEKKTLFEVSNKS